LKRKGNFRRRPDHPPDPEKQNAGSQGKETGVIVDARSEQAEFYSLFVVAPSGVVLGGFADRVAAGDAIAAARVGAA
jgi:hypothetical protein